jgi:magnesium chelatase family protein
VSIARVNKTNVYPANFMLVAAMNPCPCGQFGSGSCTCSPYKFKIYRQRISGPIIDRMDIQKFLRKVDIFADTPARKGRPSAVLKARVIKARTIQLERFRAYPDIRTNAQMDARLVEKFCRIDNESTELIKNAFETYQFSARSYHKILKVARTIADMAGYENIRKEDVVSALMARDLDRTDAVSLKGR